MSAGTETSNVYDVIENWWGERLNDDLVERLFNSPMDQLIAFRDYFYESYLPEMPGMPSSRFRPFAGSIPAGPFGTRINDDTWPNPHPVTPTLLLYAHELVIEEPLSFVLWRIGAWSPSMWWAVRPALRTLIAWRPAVETGVARLVPRLRNAQRGGNNMEQMLTVQQRCSTLTDEHALGPAERPVAFEEVDRLSWMLMVCAQWPEDIQPLCVTDRELSLVTAATEVETPERNVHALKMRRLAEMTLPALRPSINEACLV